LCHECATGVYLAELGSDLVAYHFHNLFLVQEVDLTLGRVNIDIHPCRVNLEAEIDKWFAAFGKEGGVCLLYSFLDY
jgi:hypothetical protein